MPPARGEGPLLVPIVLLASLTVATGTLAGPVFVVATRAAEQLMHPWLYMLR